MPAIVKGKGGTDRVSIINAVNKPISYFVLAILIVETILGGLAAKGPNSREALYGMFFFLTLLIVLVAGIAIFRPEALQGKRETDEGSGKLRLFSDSLVGYWWETILPAEPSALSLVEVSRDTLTQAVKLRGRAYNLNGELDATWETIASCININERKVFYYWNGRHATRPSETYEGFGEISFYESLEDADGRFSDANLAKLDNVALLKFVRFKRCNEQERKILNSQDEKSLLDLVKEKLAVV